jgi:hypothetical protein
MPQAPQCLRDLLGDEIKGPAYTTPQPEPRRKPTVRKGYAGIPGRGPEGETCKSCNHSRLCNVGGAKQFYKCVLMKAHWTGGYGSDILARSPACQHWQADADSASP